MADRPQDESAPYRDDPKEFAQSSSRVQRGVSNRYAGQGPEDTSGGPPDPEVAQGNNHGSQEDWKSPDSAASADSDDQADTKPE